ncbi:Hemopexin, partial [Nibea albiflora]
VSCISNQVTICSRASMAKQSCLMSPSLSHHLGHVDAAFRMHYKNSIAHYHMFFFLDNKVFSYYRHKPEDGYPKDISEVLPGIPDHLDAAVECPKPECDDDSVIFFKGDIYHYDVITKAVDEKEFKTMPNCTSAFCFMEHYYCFHGHVFSMFDPKRCSKFSEESDHVERERCSRVHLNAATSDFAGNYESYTLEQHDDQLYLYKAGEPHTHLNVYPKPVKGELGIIDAAFVCEPRPTAHIIKGHDMYAVELRASPRVASGVGPLMLFKKVDAAFCGADGVKVIVGNHFYLFNNAIRLLTAKALHEQHKVFMKLFGCDH